VFAWQKSKELYARKYVDEKGSTHYELQGSIFFGSINTFKEIFNPKEDSQDVIIDFA